MIATLIFIFVIGYILHATCRPHIPLGARALLLAAAGGGICIWFLTSTPEQQTNIIGWIQAEPAYVIVGFIVAGALMVAYAKYLQRREDGQYDATNEATNTPGLHDKPTP